jgi:hypothetical protein
MRWCRSTPLCASFSACLLPSDANNATRLVLDWLLPATAPCNYPNYPYRRTALTTPTMTTLRTTNTNTAKLPAIVIANSIATAVRNEHGRQLSEPPVRVEVEAGCGPSAQHAEGKESGKER